MDLAGGPGMAAAPRPPARWPPPEGSEARGSGRLAVSVTGAAGGRGGSRSRSGGGGYRGQAGGGHEEVLDALAGDLVGVVVSEGVQRMAVVGDLVAVGVAEHGDLAAQSGGGGCGRGQRWP